MLFSILKCLDSTLSITHPRPLPRIFMNSVYKVRDSMRYLGLASDTGSLDAVESFNKPQQSVYTRFTFRFRGFLATQLVLSRWKKKKSSLPILQGLKRTANTNIHHEVGLIQEGLK